ncbi:cation:proton antiporter [Sphaerisporangium album]|uniref:Cation:proton antiporter n=1 Tax=Sphaerisporangium album TaxID=509200 RepID=A0A367FTR4_9ACTN|nr:cation:proton antiporter [Sphaerisporangium album]RCG33319.1 cation:proton antiporter [Sphaerisporangium album]
MSHLSTGAVDAGPRSPEPAAPPRRGFTTLVYVLTAVVPAVIALGLLVAVSGASGRGGTTPAIGTAPIDHTVQLFVSIAMVILAAKVFGRLARRLGQPPVVGEIFAGICLGPSVLGALAPEAVGWLFAPELRPVLQGLADLGLIALMFVVGQESRQTSLRGQGRIAMAIAHAGVAGPFLGGALLAILLYRDWAGPRADPVVFAMFLGSALSITAFPVLARILAERDMLRSMLGRLSMLCAAIADVVAWCLIAAMTAIAGRDTPARAVLTVLLVIVYGVAMVWLGRPWLERIFTALEGRGEPLRLLVLLAGLLLSAAATSAIGIHAIFGAFLYGLCCPAGLLTRLTGQIDMVAGTLLLPFFFVGTGLRMDVWRSGFDAELVGVALLVIVVAMLGKLAGPMLMARSSGLSWHDSTGLGVLLNARGLTELVVLNLGLALGLIGDRLFVALVVMALVTTAMTAPLLGLLDRLRARRHGHARRL